MRKTCQSFAISASFWMVCLVVSLWLSTRSKPVFISINERLAADDFSVSPELTSILERFCNLWISTRDKIRRKPSFPSNHRYGLQFNIQNNNVHLLLCILLAGDIATNPGPAPPSKHLPIKCATINARSLKSIHKDVTTNSIICNLQRFQDFVYGENLDVVCVNETWLNENISNSEILNSDYIIFRKDRVGRNGGGVLVAIKSSSFSSGKEFVSNLDVIKELEIVSAIVKTTSNQNILFSSSYRPPDAE